MSYNIVQQQLTLIHSMLPHHIEPSVITTKINAALIL